MSLKEFKLITHIDFFNAVDLIPCKPLTDNGTDYYGYITKKDPRFDLIYELIDVENPMIADMGCGYCESLLYLGSYFEGSQLSGCEINADYYDDILDLMNTYQDVSVNVSNIDYSLYDISDKDLVYSFHPMKTVEKYNEFNSYIYDNMKVGAYWLEVLGLFSGDNTVTVLDNKPANVEVLYAQDDMVLMRKNS